LNIEITTMSSSHINSVVQIHLRAFPIFFLSFLGPRFLREFYSSFLVDSQGVGFVALSSAGQILGVIVGPVDPRGYFKRLLKRRWWKFCMASIAAVVQRPSCIPRLFRAVFYRGESPAGVQRALLSSVAVDPNVQSVGVGKKLVEHWLREVRRRGATGCYLTTDAEGNEKVNQFYQSLHWRIDGVYLTPEGRRMHRYVYDF
jgi:GNAT superfamily N-acetyltransferase